jgi:uncharacterized membrane protein
VRKKGQAKIVIERNPVVNGSNPKEKKVMASPTSPTPTAPPPAGSTSMASNVAGLLCYLLGFVTGIIFLVVQPYKNDKFVRFHAFQSIFFSIFCLIVSWVASALLVTLLFTGGFGFALLLSRLIQLGCFVAFIFLMYKAYNNEQFKLPIIGDIAAKQAGA